MKYHYFQRCFAYLVSSNLGFAALFLAISVEYRAMEATGHCVVGSLAGAAQVVNNNQLVLRSAQ